MYPGLTPGRDPTLHRGNWTDWTRQCGMSRTRGGVHFIPAVREAERVGTEVADRFYGFLQQHIRGRV